VENYDPNLIIKDYVLNDIEFESRKKTGEEKNTDCSIRSANISISYGLEEYLKKSSLIFFVKQVIENILHRMNIDDKH
jgi:hypothetical protein